jgi:transcriptional regulator with XRE-family HTH domain
MSTITKHRESASRGLGAEIKRQRQAKGLTQTELGRPLTRAFVSSVEHGRCLPSLAALAHFADRLSVSPADLLDSVKHELAALYTQRDGAGGDSLSSS